MTGLLKGLVMLAGAVILEVLASHKVPPLHRAVDLVLLVVVYYGSSGWRIGSMFAGAGGGLLEDVSFGDVMGIHGFTKTVIGYLLGGLGSRFDLTGPASRIAATLLATILDRLVEPLVQSGLGLPAGLPRASDLLWRCLGNGLAGVLLFSLAGKRVRQAA